jgi:hypothetical protein
MSRALRIRLAVASTLAVAAITGVVAAAGAAPQHHGRGQVIHIHTKQVHQTVIDNGAAGFGVDDVVVFSNDLYQGGTKIGTDGGTCTVVRATERGELTMHCLGNNMLPDGQIAVQGFATPGEPFQLGITGGTGRYSKVRGQVVGHNTSPTEMDIDLVLR